MLACVQEKTPSRELTKKRMEWKRCKDGFRVKRKREERYGSNISAHLNKQDDVLSHTIISTDIKQVRHS